MNQKKRTKADLRKDLHFYIEYYNKVPEHMRVIFDKEIQEIIEILKQLGKK